MAMIRMQIVGGIGVEDEIRWRSNISPMRMAGGKCGTEQWWGGHHRRLCQSHPLVVLWKECDQARTMTVLLHLMFLPIVTPSHLTMLHCLCTFLLIITNSRWSTLMALIAESDGHMTYIFMHSYHSFYQSTRNWNNISNSSPTKDKMIGWGCCHLRNSSITTRFILPLNTLLSSLTLGVFLGWALNQTNLGPVWNPSMSSKTEWRTP